MDYKLGATSFHEDPEDCFDEPSLSIQFSLGVATFSAFSIERRNSSWLELRLSGTHPILIPNLMSKSFSHHSC